MKFEQVCQSLNGYFSQHPIFRVLMPIGGVGLIVCAVLDLVQCFISMGDVIPVLVYFGYIVFLLVTLAACNFRYVAIGLALYGVQYLYFILNSLIRYRHLSVGSLLYLAVYGFLAYLAYRKSVGFN